MKKLIIICLLSVYACSQVAPAIWVYSKPMIRMIFSARQRIRSISRNSEELLAIETDMPRFRQMQRGNHEVILNGTLHDIEKITITGNRVHLMIRKDEDETFWLRFHETVDKWLQKKLPQQDESSGSIVKWLLKIYCNSPGKILRIVSHSEYKQVFHNLVKCNLPISPYLTRIGRPPDSRC